MVRAIIFDCFGVLTADAWKEFVATLPEAQRGPADSLNRAFDAGHLSLPEFIGEVRSLTGSVPRFADDAVQGLPKKNQALLEYIKGLHRHYKIGLLSNVASNWIRDELLSTEEQQLFDAYVMSFETGLTKPDPRMYRLTAERLGVEPGDCVFIDDVERYCTAAEELGMQSVVYQSFPQMKAELEKLLA